MNLDECTLPIPDRVFPPELERNIFEISALAHPGMIPRFILVTRRVQEWLEPFLYRVVFLANRPPFSRLKFTILLRAIQNKPVTFFRGAVRHLYIDDQVTDLEKRTILAACTGITNHCAPTRLTAHQKYLGDLPLKNITLSHVTHLEGLERLDGSEVSSPTGWATLTAFQGVLGCVSVVGYNSSGNLATILAPILITCARLECAIFHLQNTWEEAEVEADAAWSTNNVRFVTMREELDLPADWVHGAETGYDVWVRADTLVAAKRATEVQRNQLPVLKIRREVRSSTRAAASPSSSKFTVNEPIKRGGAFASAQQTRLNRTAYRGLMHIGGRREYSVATEGRYVTRPREVEDRNFGVRVENAEVAQGLRDVLLRRGTSEDAEQTRNSRVGSESGEMLKVEVGYGWSAGAVPSITKFAVCLTVWIWSLRADQQTNGRMALGKKALEWDAKGRTHAQEASCGVGMRGT
ncbi:hypothetical protein DFH09DRAFT_1069511 [Mycena vulgaris]|nr:hypothetical protein DFH09DRAFT_1069511 [Mycena vulgaris]